jgi:hypothetical protein
MTKRVIDVVVCLALIGPAVVQGRGETPRNRDEDALLLIVGRLELRVRRDFKCVAYVEDDRGLKTRPVSDWLLDRLRGSRPGLVNCDDWSDDELLLGPVRWIKPGKAAMVTFGGLSPMTGRNGYYARRGFLGRWRLAPLVRE